MKLLYCLAACLLTVVVNADQLVPNDQAIQPGRSSSTANNQRNVDKCQLIGAVDITDSSLIQLGSNTRNPSVCYKTDDTNDTADIQAYNNNQISDVVNPITDVSATAMNSSFQVGDYRLEGIGDWHTNRIVAPFSHNEVRVTAGVTEDSTCFVSVTRKRVHKMGVLYVYADCTATATGNLQSYATVDSNEDNQAYHQHDSDYGTITIH